MILMAYPTIRFVRLMPLGEHGSRDEDVMLLDDNNENAPGPPPEISRCAFLKAAGALRADGVRRSTNQPSTGGVMGTRERLIDASAIRQAGWRRASRHNQWVTTRMYAAVMTLALMLPALVPVIEFFGPRSLAFLLVGIFLKGFGVPFYILLCWFLEADIANETERAQYLPTGTFDEALALVPHTVFAGQDDRKPIPSAPLGGSVRQRSHGPKVMEEFNGDNSVAGKPVEQQTQNGDYYEPSEQIFPMVER
jgi:hypothetical protein